jgi:hypothetical protein
MKLKKNTAFLLPCPPFSLNADQKGEFFGHGQQPAEQRGSF